MTRGQRFTLCTVVALSIAAGVASHTQAAAAQDAAQMKTMLSEGRLCTLPTDRGYSLGAMVKYQDEYYKCVKVYGENMKPAGAAWIVIEKPTAEVR